MRQIQRFRSLYHQIRIYVRARRYLRKAEPSETRFACDCLQAGEVALDIGAHKAAYTYWLSRAVGRSGHVYAFEPQPKLAAVLQGYAAVVRAKNIRVCEVALSDQRRNGKLEIPSAFTAWAKLLPSGHDNHDAVDVPVETLDDYLEAIGARRPVSFIKCDVELHELEVLRGGHRLLETDRPVLLLESYPLSGPAKLGGPNRTFEFLTQLGYRGYFFHQSMLVPLDNYAPEEHPLPDKPIQNYVFLHPDAVHLACSRPPYRVAKNPRRSAA